MADKPKKKLKYIIEESLWAENLEKGVSEMMDEGYVPHGSMIFQKDRSGNTFFYQPMILKKEKEKIVI